MILVYFLLCILFVNAKQQVDYESIEGDVRLTPAQQEKVYRHHKPKLRGANHDRLLGTIGDEEVVGLWRFHRSNNRFIIPVVFDENDEFEGNNTMSQGVADSIWVKMKEMEDKLGNIIEFVKEFDKNDHLDGYIRIGSYTNGCWSYVGRLPTIYQPQVVNLATFCDFTDVVEHEMMHALGFFHEQARPDRNSYVTVHWSNIPGDKVGNFEIADGINSRDSPYDRRSVMHYDNFAFAIDNQQPTMSSTDNSQPLLGSSFTMTDTDMTQIRMLYRCALGPVSSYNTNCGELCPCRLNEGKCSSDIGCNGTLICDTETTTCVEAAPTPSPSASPTTSPTTSAPTTVGATGAPSASPTTSPTTRAPTTEPPTTGSPTTRAPTSPSAPSSEVNLGLVIGLSTIGLGILIGTIFM